MWYLNFCSPFLFTEGSSTMTYRYVMYSQIVALGVMYIVIRLAYMFYSTEEDEIPKIAKQDAATLLKASKMKCSPKQFWATSKRFKQWYLSHFGMHAVAVGICVLYSPYLPQMVFALIHFALWVLANILFHLRNRDRRALIFVYNATMVLTGLLNIMLLFSGSMGVGASGYDENAKICLLQSGQLDQL